jgi:murein L,D-transpeptidase YafK
MTQRSPATWRQPFCLAVILLLLVNGGALAASAQLPANLLISGKAGPYHVILVEKASQRLFLYRFDGEYRLLRSYACATGERKGNKRASGDRKTPEGVYFFTRACEQRYLSPIYGARAFPMNYPNLIDRRQGKHGDGIWLHGISEKLKPRSTKGCIAMTNRDILELESYIQLWQTPIIVEDRLAYEEPASLRRQGGALLEQIEGWRKAWSRKELDDYLSHYSSEFRWKSLNLHGWRERKARLNRLYREISVQLSDLRLFRHGNMVLAACEELYRSDRFASHGFKHLYLVQNSRQWRIVGEQWHKSDRPPPPPLQLAAASAEPPEVSIRRFVEQWRQAWERGDLPTYLACYHPRFKTGAMDRQTWKRHKRDLFTRWTTRHISLSEIRIQEQDRTATVAFKQRYRAPNHKDYGLKTLYLGRYQGRWTILNEIWQPLAERG